MKVWHIQTWGANAPHYLVSAETKEDAWEMVFKEWNKTHDFPLVGGYESATRGFIYQTIYDLIEIEGLTTQTSLIVDLN